MKKRYWIYFVLLPLVLTWAIDQFTKLLAIQYLTSVKFYGILGLVRHHNFGAMLGFFSDLPPVLRVVSLSTGGAFLIFIFIVIQYILPRKLAPLRTGLSILLGGILGNVTDRIINGYITDFIFFNLGSIRSPVFNIADALQWVGYILVVTALINNGKDLWPDNDSRKKFLINPQFQIKYSMKLVMLGLAFAIVIGVYSYTYMQVTIIDLVGHQDALEKKFLIPYILTFGIMAVTFILFLFFAGLLLSHRAAGPLYAFEKFLIDLSKGNIRPLKLRSGDEFTHLEKLAESLSVRMADFLKNPNEFSNKSSEPSEATAQGSPSEDQDPKDKRPKE